VPNASGNADVDRARLRRDAAAQAVRARVVDDLPGPPAFHARLAEPERALVAADEPAAAAVRAPVRRRTGPGSRPTAGPARRRAGESQRQRRAVRGLVEVQGEVGRDVLPAGGAGGGARGPGASGVGAEQPVE